MRTVFAILTLVLWGQFALAQSQGTRGAAEPNVLQVRVRDGQGNQISSLVRLTLLRGEMPFDEQYLDSRGEYESRELPDGNYSVEISAPGYETQTRDASLYNGRSLTLQFFLQPITTASVVVPEKDYTISARWLAAPEKARSELQKSRELRQKGDVHEALKQAQAALKIAPGFSFALHEIGMCSWRLGRLNDARIAFQQARDADPSFLPSTLNLAEVMEQQKDYKAAGAILQKASQEHSSRAEPFYIMGRIQFETGHLELAEKALSLALDRDWNEIPQLQILLAKIYLSRGEKEKAVNALTAYLEKAPAGPEAEQARKTLKELRP